MSISQSQFKIVYLQLLAAYVDIDDLGMVLALLDSGVELDDISPPDRVRKRRILDVVTKARSQGWISDLIHAVLNDASQALNDGLKQELTPILAVLEPEPGVAAHHHLTTDGVAFANRTTLRGLIGDMTLLDGPKSLVLRGKSLCGTSYVWRLLNHVARDSAIERVRIDFEQAGDHSPIGVALSLAAEMGITVSPVRTDNPTHEQLSAYIVRWMSGFLRTSPRTWWIVFDNAQKLTVPPETKEMIIAFARHFIGGSIDNVRVFVLGFDNEISGLAPPHGINHTVTPIGRPEVVDFLKEASQKLHGPLGFPDADSAADDLLDGVDLENPSRNVMASISQQLNRIIAGMRQ